MTRGEKLSYTVPALALAAIGIPLYIFVPKFYTDTVGVPVAFIGQVLLLVRLFDAISDPMVGWLSDRTRSRLGRRRPWILWGSFPLAATFFLLLTPPVEASATFLQWWLAGGAFLAFLFWTMVAIPYEALGAELTFDYDERTDLLGLREAFVIGGTVLAAATPVVVGWWLGGGDDPASERSKFLGMGAFYALLLVGLCSWCALAVRERVQAAVATANLRDAVQQVMTHRSFLILLLAFVVSSLGSNLPPAVVLYYVEYVLQSAHGELFLLLYLGLNVLFLPAWIWLAHRRGKKFAWLASLGMMVASFIWAMGLGAGDEGKFVVICILTGIAGGSVLAMPHAMQADVIDEDELRSGERREGQYIGMWNIARKASAALSVGVGLWVLGRAGYAPGQEQPAAVVQTLKYLYILVPTLCFAGAGLIGLLYPLDKATHEGIRASIEAKGLPSAGR